MRTRLSVFCDKVIEAGWLTALVVVPLFFNIYSQRVFEPDKLSLLRSLAVLMSSAWLVRVVEDWRAGGKKEGPRVAPWRWVTRTPMVLPTLLLVLIYLISTATSLDWRVSLLGSYQRLQGTYTTLSYIVIFLLVLEGLRTKRQLNRMITTAILVSFPIAMYGLVQHFGLDPLPWGGPVTTRVASNMGNAIFVAAYLILVVPLTLSRLLENWKEAIGPFDTRDGFLGFIAFALLAVSLLAGMLARNGENQAWVRWVALAIGIGLQVPLYFLSPAERRPRVLAISLPLTFAFLVGLAWILEILIPPAQGADASRYLWLGILAALVFVVAMAAFAYYLRKPVSRTLLLAAYFVILIAQVGCIFYTQSRGPLLGLLGGVFAFFAVLGLVKRRLWLPWLMTVAAALTIAFLILFNTVNWPVIERLRETPYIGRLGKVLQTEEGTGKVRVLIWEGVTKMMSPHEPLQFPGENGGPDRLNALRPILGYGPESMYVAYNRFYPPDLAHFEKRNASPDRSHNETFDALTITGISGFLVYVLVFASLFYYTLKWLGLIERPWQKWAFAGLWISGGIAGVLAVWAWRGPAYIGVGVPAGVVVGVASYLLISLLAATFRPQRTPDQEQPIPGGQGGRYALWLVALFSAIVAHFIEIHLGIAIASTRTYFWVYAAMLVVIGTRLAVQPAGAEPVRAEERGSKGAGEQRSRGAGEQRGASANRNGKRRRPPASAPKPQAYPGRAPWLDDWLGSLLVWSLLGVIMLSTMLFDWVTIQPNEPGLLATLWQSFTQRAGQASPIMLVLFLATWGMIALVGLGDLATREESLNKRTSEWLKGLGIFVLVTSFGVLLFGLLHAARLKPVTLASANAPNPLVNTITFYYLYAFLIVVALAFVLTFLFRRATLPCGVPLLRWRWTGKPADLAFSAALAVVPLAVLLIFVSNLTVIRSDILYKQGLSSERASDWDGAIFFYNKAIALAPDQDFYYLFLGRAIMEKGRTATADVRDKTLQESERALLKARLIAPLNTDHSANLARLYRTWGGLSKEPLRTERLTQALRYYADATNLSRHNAQLFDEWGQTYLALGDVDQAEKKYQQSLALDQKYAQTYGLLGDLYVDQSRWEEAVLAYQQAVKLDPKSADTYSSMGFAYSQQKDLQAALAAYQKAAELRPNNFANRKNLAIVYQQLGRIEDAIPEATEALKLAPDSQKAEMESYLAQLEAQSSGLSPKDAQKVQDLLTQGNTQTKGEEWAAAEDTFRQVVALDPNNARAHSGLAFVYAKQGKVDQAITENLAVLDLLGDDYGTFKNLAVLYQQKEEIAKAVAAAEQALALAPEEDAQEIQAFLDQFGQASGAPTPSPTTTQSAADLEPSERNNMYSAPPPMTIDPRKSYQATIVTEKGDIILELYADRAPNTVNNLVFLARQGFYDNTTFHRVIPGFMAQGGDPTGTGRGGPGYRFADEIDPGLRFDGPGILAMANAGPNTNGSQFFITYAAASWLDGNYSILGRMTEGMEVLQSITSRDPQQNPAFPGDKILTIDIAEK